MTITRFKGQAAGRNRCVEYGGTVYTVATAKGDGIKEQTERTLAHLDESLAMAGSDKTRILQAQIFLADMDQKAEMDEVWNAWIGDDWQHWPQRACVGAPLAPGTLVEIVLTAAKA
ncbi:MAG: RidA family protein [Rickettsiales bacterium]|jgi:enamine deaminase RidA (YjgF/YER057c/UK114 family)